MRRVGKAAQLCLEVGMPDPIIADSLATLTGVAHGFFTRHGGVSQGIYAALNCGLGSHDDPEAVRENRTRVAAHVGAHSLITAHQVHGTTALVVDEAWPQEARPKADAIVTTKRGLAIGVLTADCTPVLFADGQAGVVAATHAGWRGALSGILEATITAMQRLGARPERIAAAVGPCIGQAAYQVGPDFEQAFLERDPASASFIMRPEPGARPHFDLGAYVRWRLDQAGVAGNQMGKFCTYADGTEFFSFRRSQALGEPDYGRQISAIVLT
jgi:YfiH family protein